MLRRLIVALVVAIVAGPIAQIGGGTTAHATQPGTDGKIAFSSDVDGRVEVYVANPDGTGVTELTDSPDARGPSWSPDGTSLAFAGGPNPSGIYTMTAAGTGLHRVTDGWFSTAWSPDGSHVAFGRSGSPGPDIYTANVDGTGVQDVAPSAQSPAWSPDGKKLAFARTGIWTVNPDGSGQAQLSNNGSDNHPSYSPDGTKIAFDSTRSGTLQLWVMNADGSSPTQITSSSSIQVAEPSWSPDGSAMAVRTFDGTNYRLAVMSADGSGLHTIVSNMSIEGPQWQPIPKPKPPYNGKIVFTSQRDGNYEIYNVNPDGSALANLTHDPGTDWWPTVSPDGSKIAFGSSRNSTPGLYVMNADGSNVHLVAPDGGGFGTSWSGDGSKIAYVAPNPTDHSLPDVWTVNADGANPTDVISGGQNRFPSFSADGTKIIWDNTGTPQAGLSIANADGSSRMRLTDDSTGIDQKASFAPDGKTIIFNRAALPPNSNASSELWTMNADGTGQRQLTGFGGYNAWPRYSPDGHQIVFQQSSVGSDGPFDIAIMNADATGARTLAANTADDEFADWQPLAQPALAGAPTLVSAAAGNSWARVAWTAPLYDGGSPVTGYTVTASPSGATVTVPASQTSATVPGLTNGTAYTFTVQGVNSAGTGLPSAPSNVVTPVARFNGRIAFSRGTGSVSQVFTANSDGTGATQITNDAGGSAFPSWSPDGTQIAIDGGPSPQGVYIINADGTNPRRVSDSPALFISWSPDGRKLAYIRPGIAANTVDIATVNVDGTGETHLGTGLNPVWTPDSQRIVFLNNRKLWVMNQDGTGRMPIGDSIGASSPSVSPDGTKVTYSSGGIRVIGIDGSNPTVLNSPTGADWPRWSADGRQIVYQTGPSGGSGPSTLAVMNADGSGSHAITSGQVNDQFADWQPLAQDPNGTFVPLPPTRILDTRQTSSPIGPNKSIDVQITGHGGVPAAGVTAVVVNLTATQPTAGSYLTAYPTGGSVPLASNLNFGPGQTIANLVTVKVSSGGKFSVYNAAGNTHALVDVVGWYSDGSVVPGDRYTPLNPARILDTRNPNGPVGPNKSIDVQATGVGNVPQSGVAAVVVNLTATGATAPSYLTAYPTGTTAPVASNLNFNPGQTIANLVVVKLGTGGKFSVYNAQGTTHVIADVVGWYSDGAQGAGDRFVPWSPQRIVDTRDAGGYPSGPIRPNSSVTVPVAPGNASSVVVNLTATEPTAVSYLTVYPAGQSVPMASNLNFDPGETIANLAVVKISPTAEFSIYNAQGSTHVIVDLVGWFVP